MRTDSVTLLCDPASVTREGFLERPVWLGRIQQQSYKLLLRLTRKANYFDLSDGLLRCYLSRGNHKIADGPALNLSCAAHDGEAFLRNTGLQAGGSCTLWH